MQPPVQIEQFVADRKTYDATYDGGGPLRLPPLIRDLQIDYTALSLAAPEKIRFRYRLEGRDSDWQEAGNRRQVFYNDLGPGNYRFRVIACNNSGVWNETGAYVDFTIAAAYYQTAWFRILVVLLFLVSARRSLSTAAATSGACGARADGRTSRGKGTHCQRLARHSFAKRAGIDSQVFRRLPNKYLLIYRLETRWRIPWTMRTRFWRKVEIGFEICASIPRR